MKFNTSKRGFIIVLIALCLTVVGVPVLADETAGPYADPDTGLIAINPMLLSASPVQMTMFTVKPGESSGLITTTAPWNSSRYAGTATALRPAYSAAGKTASPLYDTLLESFRANPRAMLSPPGGNSPLYCSGGY
jgi:hypothetical protein